MYIENTKKKTVHIYNLAKTYISSDVNGFF